MQSPKKGNSPRRFHEDAGIPSVEERKINCDHCKTTQYMRFDCIYCCVRWLRQMTPAERETNAPVIVSVMGEGHMEKVRQSIRDELKAKKQQY